MFQIKCWKSSFFFWCDNHDLKPFKTIERKESGVSNKQKSLTWNKNNTIYKSKTATVHWSDIFEVWCGCCCCYCCSLCLFLSLSPPRVWTHIYFFVIVVYVCWFVQFFFSFYFEREQFNLFNMSISIHTQCASRTIIK